MEDELDLESSKDVIAKEDPMTFYIKNKRKNAMETIVRAGRMLAPLVNPDSV